MTGVTSRHEPFEVAILAGGKGTRLKDRSGGLPKPLVPVLGKAVLQHQIEQCRAAGFTRILLLVHHQHTLIAQALGDGATLGVTLGYHVEAEPRGTAGALSDALPLMAGRFLVLYGDTFFDVDLRRFWDAHQRAGADATLFLHPNDHPHDSDLVELDTQSRVVAVRPYPHAAHAVYPNLVNAALYVLERAGLDAVLPASGQADLAKHTFPAMLAAGRHLHGHVSPEYIKDMGTPDRLDKVEQDLLAGVPDRLSSRQFRQAVFLDRDGTLNVEVDHLRTPEQLKLLDGAADAVRQLNRAGVLAVCVTNQPVVARGEATLPDLARIHAALDQQLGEGRAYLDRLYACPHHPDRGFEGEVPELKITCACRKPGTGLIDRAVIELDISRQRSWMVGDTTSDMLAGARAGLHTVLVRTGYGGADAKHHVEPDYVAPDLPAAVQWILHGHGSITRQLLPLLQACAGARVVLLGGPARAGKSSTARVLADMLWAAGRSATVLSMDGWLRAPDQRPEGQGVLQRYDLQTLHGLLEPLLHRDRRHWFTTSLYDRKSRATRPGPLKTVGPDDTLIVEGVPALMDPVLRQAAAVRLFVDLDDTVRQTRLRADYAWRGLAAAETGDRLRLREQDEVAAVRASALTHATHQILGH